MIRYFENKIGETLHYTLTTGDNFFTRIYAKQYSLEVIQVSEGKVMFEITSNNITPSKMIEHGTYKNYGEIIIEISKDSKRETIWNAIQSVDNEFINKYNLSINDLT